MVPAVLSARPLGPAPPRVFDTTYRIFELADEEGVPPSVAADRLAERRIADVGGLRRIWLDGSAATFGTMVGRVAAHPNQVRL